MDEAALATWLADLERRLALEPVPETPVLLAYVAGRDVAFDDELPAALRRAVLLAAAGGDPHRDLDVDSLPVTALADGLDTEERRTALAHGLDDLVGRSARLPRVRGALFELAARPTVAWRAFACALLAEELGDDS